ncbi:MAG: AMP-binding protein, partial [Micromonosporaceae bacterium]|nr:AMP-binding protein [Micromonosporaceae bacterium]
FVGTVAGLTQVGAQVVLLPPELAPDRLAAVVARERLTAIVHDGEFETQVAAVGWPELAAAGRATGTPARRPRRPGTLAVLSSGTGEVPRSATPAVPLPTLLRAAATHQRLVPLRPGEPLVLAVPACHGYGLVYLAAGLALGVPVVLAEGYSAEQILAAVAEQGAGVLVALPVQLRRIADLPAQVRDGYRLSGLRAVLTGCDPLPPELSGRLGEVFGDKVFNLYGSTEAGWATIATPADLRDAPGTVGRAPHGVRVQVLDGGGSPVPPGRTGIVHVTGWRRGAAVSTGDLGHFDLAGRLHLDGRLADTVPAQPSGVDRPGFGAGGPDDQAGIRPA